MTRLLVMGLLMTLLAGFVDAIGYVSLGQLYLSFMSGNTTQWALALAVHNQGVVAWGTAVITTFLLGCTLGPLIALRARVPVAGVLGFEFLCCITALALTALTAGRVALLPIAAAMGAQNAAHRLIHGADTGRTFVTGTLVSLGRALAQGIRGRPFGAEALTNLSSWLAFVSGVIAGAVSLPALGLVNSLALATSGLAALAALALRLPEPPPPEMGGRPEPPPVVPNPRYQP
jgi:oxalate decarboxylase